MKKLLAIVISMAMIVAMMPMGVFAGGSEVVTSVKTAEELQNALTESGNANIRLEKNVEIDNLINISAAKTAVIDLGGHVLSSNGDAVFWNEGNLELKNGTVKLADDNDGVTLWQSGASKLTIDKDATIVAGKSFAIAMWSTCTASELILNGKINGTCGVTVNGNVKTKGNTITVGKDAEIDVTGMGLYLAGVANTTINGAKIKGKDTAIELRAGNLVINDGTFEATTSEFTCTPNGNGTTTTGAALAIAQHTTKKNISITINGGIFKGVKALNESNPQNNDPAPQVTLAVKDGTFNGAVSVEDASGFIFGGKFSGDVSAYVADGYVLTGDTVVKNTNSADAAASIDEQYFKTLAGAFAAAKQGDTVKLLKDYEESEPKDAGIVYNIAGVTFDLGGNTYKSNNFSHIFEGSNGVIKNGKMVCLIGKSYALFIGDENDTKGFTVEDVECTGGINVYNASDVVLKNVKVKGTNYYAVWADCAAQVIIESGEYTSDGTAVIGISAGEGGSVQSIKITGGAFTNKPNQNMFLQGDNNNNYGKPIITGGTFSSDPSAYVASGYYVDKSGDAWTVKPVPYVPSTPPTDNVTNNPTDKNTTADLAPAVKDNKAETTVDAKTADKIVDKAVENKSTEVIVDATGNNTVASSEVAIPEKTVKELAEKTDANLVIKTDNGKVDLDKTALAAVAEQAGTTGTVRLVVETVKTDENICHVDLKLITSNGAVKDFRGGNVKVTINLTKELAAKELVCVYIDDNGIYTLVEGVLNADGTYTFVTGHFSEYAVMAKDEADKVIADQLKTMIKDVNLKVRTSKTSKKNIKAVVSGDVKALTDAGYTVKYKFYRSIKKASKYAVLKTKADNTYINTKGKKGTKYYYKAKALVYQGDKLVGQTELKQCKYGVRTWSK